MTHSRRGFFFCYCFLLVFHFVLFLFLFLLPWRRLEIWLAARFCRGMFWGCPQVCMWSHRRSVSRALSIATFYWVSRVEENLETDLVIDSSLMKVAGPAQPCLTELTLLACWLGERRASSLSLCFHLMSFMCHVPKISLYVSCRVECMWELLLHHS